MTSNQILQCRGKEGGLLPAIVRHLSLSFFPSTICQAVPFVTPRAGSFGLFFLFRGSYHSRVVGLIFLLKQSHNKTCQCNTNNPFPHHELFLYVTNLRYPHHPRFFLQTFPYLTPRITIKTRKLMMLHNYLLICRHIHPIQRWFIANGSSWKTSPGLIAFSLWSPLVQNSCSVFMWFS